MESTAVFLDAVKAGELTRVKELLHADPGLAKARNDSGVSAVLVALYYGRKEIAEVMLGARTDLDIFEAAATGRAERVEKLLAQDRSLANTYAADGFTPLGLAAFFGHRNAVDALLAHGAEVNAVSRNSTGYTALTGAVAGGHKEVVAALLAGGASAAHRYGQGYTPLHEAASSGKTEIVKLLLQHGADPHARTEDGKTPLSMATEKGLSEVVRLLRQHGARV